MAIRFVHNDPKGVPFVETVIGPAPARSTALADFDMAGLAGEQVYPLGSPEFVDWQCREAALRTLTAWETVAGPLAAWHGDRRTIDLLPRHGIELAASYRRTSLGFGQWPGGAAGDPTFFVGASADAVSHEVGHAILDARRPELWESLFTEVAAFHEGFSDCVALLVALFDHDVTDVMFAGAAQPAGVLQADNPSAQVAESVAAAIRQAFGDDHPASLPRRLKNDLQWAIPTTLPPAPAPDNLSREPHSFGRVFTGCFYDCIENIYRDGAHSRDGLEQAATIVGSLLARALDTATEELRFFRSVGRAMIHADSEDHAGQHHLAIRDAFAAHNVALGSSAALTPTMALAGPSPLPAGADGRNLNPETRKDLLARAAAGPNVRVAVNTHRVAGRHAVRAAMRRHVPMMVPGFSGTPVLSAVNEEVLLGTQNDCCVLLGELPNRQATEQEVTAFLETLAEGGGLESAAPGGRRSHALHKRKRGRLVRRICFTCVPS